MGQANKRIFWVYLLIGLIFVTFSPGEYDIQRLAEAGDVPSGAWLLFIPTPVVYMIAVLINTRRLVPRYLLQNRLKQYLLRASVLAYFAALLSSLAEDLIRLCVELPIHAFYYSHFLIFFDAFGNGVMLMLLFFCFALWGISGSWRRDIVDEKRLSDNLEEYMKAVDNQLNLYNLIASLKLISRQIGFDPEVASKMIEELSDSIRQRLSGLPAPPAPSRERETTRSFERLSEVLVGSKYKKWRNVGFILLLTGISALSPSMDAIPFSPKWVAFFLSLFVMLLFLAYINILCLYPRFEKKRSLRSYVRSVALLLCLVLLPILLTVPRQAADVATDRESILWAMEMMSLAAAVFAIILYEAGISAFLLFQHWIRTQRNIELLRAETLRQEYAYLRKQINPHFLFNVLNSIEITAFEDRALSQRLVRNMIRLLEYQLEERHRERTTVREEIGFLENYLTLEKSRRDRFSFQIIDECGDAEVSVPSQIFIPFVENAVKYGGCLPGDKKIEIAFKIVGDYLIFSCSNPYDDERSRKLKHGGIGLSNTLRRLQLLYDGAAEAECTRADGQFNVELKLPIRK